MVWNEEGWLRLACGGRFGQWETEEPTGIQEYLFPEEEGKDYGKEDFDLAINSGLYATFFYMRAAYPYLKESHGSVINFASGAGLFGKLGQSSYAAAKEGIRGLSRVAAAEWGPDNINVNVICPLAMTEGLTKWKE